MIRCGFDALVVRMQGMVSDKADGSRALHSVASAAVAFWKQQALKELRSTSRDYANNITVEYGEKIATITLGGMLPNLIENGFPGGDMRKWMLNSPKAKVGKRGRYLIIPFQHGTPTTAGRNVGTPMPDDIYKAAKKLKPTLSRLTPAGGGKSVAYGDRLTAASKGVNDNAARLLTERKKAWHAGSIYEGMIRQAKTFKSPKQQTTGYNTFRVISEGVNRGAVDNKGAATEHWFHPGIRPRRLALKVQDYIKRSAGEGFKSNVLIESGK